LGKEQFHRAIVNGQAPENVVKRKAKIGGVKCTSSCGNVSTAIPALLQPITTTTY
jgi:hypothetical protein